ncbi:hypothetical protein SeMB42_g05186 [Synchytrium endobioticum]|nr:hypothetical protein SeMB42_g05186 [Synchytrium endobioticum]
MPLTPQQQHMMWLALQNMQKELLDQPRLQGLHHPRPTSATLPSIPGIPAMLPVTPVSPLHLSIARSVSAPSWNTSSPMSTTANRKPIMLIRYAQPLILNLPLKVLRNIGFCLGLEDLARALRVCTAFNAIFEKVWTTSSQLMHPWLRAIIVDDDDRHFYKTNTTATANWRLASGMTHRQVYGFFIPQSCQFCGTLNGVKRIHDLRLRTCRDCCMQNTISHRDLYADRKDAAQVFGHLPFVTIIDGPESSNSSSSETLGAARYCLTDALTTVGEYSKYLKRNKLEEWRKITGIKKANRFCLGQALRDLEIHFLAFVKTSLENQQASNTALIAELARRFHPEWRLNVIKGCTSYQNAAKMYIDLSPTAWKLLEQSLVAEMPLVIADDIRVLVRDELIKLNRVKESRQGSNSLCFPDDDASLCPGSLLVDPDTQIPSTPDYWDRIIMNQILPFLTPSTNALEVVQGCLRTYSDEYHRVYRDAADAWAASLAGRRVVSFACVAHADLALETYPKLFEHLFMHHRLGDRVDETKVGIYFSEGDATTDTEHPAPAATGTGTGTGIAQKAHEQPDDEQDAILNNFIAVLLDMDLPTPTAQPSVIAPQAQEAQLPSQVIYLDGDDDIELEEEDEIAFYADRVKNGR